MPLALVPVLVDVCCAGAPDDALAAAWRGALRPALDALWAQPVARAALHLGGSTGRWAQAQDPEGVALLAELVKKGRVELLASGMDGAPLALIPERDALAQLRRHQRWLAQALQATPAGLWPLAEAWDPALVGIAARAGLKYSFCDPGLIALGGGPADRGGWVRTTRGGSGLALLPLDRARAAMSPWTPPARVLQSLEQSADAGDALAVVAIPAPRLGAWGPEGAAWWRELLGQLGQSRVRTLLPSAALARVPAAGRAWPPAGTSPRVGLAAGPGAEERLDTGWMAVNGLPDAPPGPPLDALVAGSPGGQALLDRALRVSEALAALRRGARKGSPEAAAADAATPALHRGQSATPLFDGDGADAAHPGLRHAGWRALDEAEASLRRVCPPGAPAPADLDGDGADELEVVTPHLTALLRPAAGGAISELLVHGIGNLVNTAPRGVPPWGRRYAPPLPVLVPEPGPAPGGDDEDDADPPTAPPAPPITPPPPLPAPPDLHRAAWAYDPFPRHLLQEHVLGPAATLSTLARGRGMELGDFAGGEYRLERAEADASGALVAVMVREGVVRQPSRADGMLQIHKRLRFPSDAPRIELQLELVNRGREPLEARFGLALHLNLDGRAGPDRTLHLPGLPPLPFDGESEHEGISDLALRFADQGLIVRARADRPATLLQHPLVRARRGPAGYEPALQGTCLLLCWPLRLWGEERTQLQLSLDLLRRDRGDR